MRSAPRREVLDDGTVRFDDPDCTTVVTRLSAGIVLLTFTGHDKGQFGTAVRDELDRDIRRYGYIEVFVDTREAFNADVGVGSAWSDWLSLNRRGLTRMSVLVASKYIALTAEVMKLLSRTGELMRIYTDAPAFSDAITQALGRHFELGAPRR